MTRWALSNERPYREPSEVAEDLPGGEWRRIQKSKGHDWILVNGEITVENGEPTGALPGKFLPNGRG